MDILRKVLSGQEEGGATEGPRDPERANQTPTWSRGRRVKGFLVCFILGAIMSLLATFMLWTPGAGLPVFVVFYSLGNICALASTMFLVGPWDQLRSMCAKERALATALILVCLVVTLCAAYWWNNFTIALIFCILQLVAFTWYALSYVPFARDVILKLCSIICC